MDLVKLYRTLQETDSRIFVDSMNDSLILAYIDSDWQDQVEIELAINDLCEKFHLQLIDFSVKKPGSLEIYYYQK
jgi:hypothetical protein